MEFYGPANEGEKLEAVTLNWPRSIIWVNDGIYVDIKVYRLGE